MDLYFTVKALHLIALISWFAGLFYLPRLFVYHAENQKNQDCCEMLVTMERKLLRFIMNPAMVLTWGFGITMAMLNPAVAHGGWFHTKMALVVMLSGYHMSLAVYRRRFAEERNVKSGKFFRFYNEVPTILLIIVVFLAVLKPF